MLEHGGRLRDAANRFDIPLENWLDLSTGINPSGWPVPEIPPACWNRLPEENDGLGANALSYYGAEHILPVSGSQAAIQALPKLRRTATQTKITGANIERKEPRREEQEREEPEHEKIAVISPGYAEHAHAWRQSGYDVEPINAPDIDAGIDNFNVLVLINPNNPTGARFDTDQLLNWHQKLHARGGWLIVDEAFMDATPEFSLCEYATRPGLIVLRSLGKFFGMAGARVGFVVANTDLLSALHRQVGPWSVNGPARFAASSALADIAWQKAARTRLIDESARLHKTLTSHNLPPTGGTALFQWVKHKNALDIFNALASHGILTRHFTEPSSLRFGLPGSEENWRRLDAALAGRF